MRFTRLLCSYKPPVSSSSPAARWKIPEKKRRININFQVSKVQPKELFWRMVNAPYRSYFYYIGGIALVGGLGFCVQFFYAQYKLRSSDYSLTAVRSLEQFPQLMDILGRPVQAGHVYPSVRNGIQDDEVRVNIPITGKKSNGLLQVHAVKDGNIWSIRSMNFTFTDRAGGAVRLIKDPAED
ncbi:uncharacterized protein LOC135843449 [Planococcus citri]|uniref:uncharacterized protein LOC135843449 n=1 Tax=Planococcus citri TaxID=170843 RepID=UPI0031F9590C